LLLTPVVHPADVQDRDGARQVLAETQQVAPRLARWWADGAYAGELVEWAKEEFGWTVEIVRRAADAVGFVVEPKRWIVERTFAWFGRYRRLSKDYEENAESSEAWLFAAMTHILVRRLATA
jgi:putative transposase